MKDRDRLNIVFFGSGSFAVPILERLAHLLEKNSSYQLLSVITRPDRPAGRGRKTQPTPLRIRGNELGLEVEAPKSTNEAAFLDRLQKMCPDLFLVADFGEFLGKRFRSLPDIGAFNFHGSLLPRHRGASPVAHAILHGDRVTGVTLFRIEKIMDSGSIIDSIETEIKPDETAGELESRLSSAAADLLEKCLPDFLAGKFSETPQDAAAATPAPKLTKSQGELNWNLTAKQLDLYIRAMNPWPCAYTHIIPHGSKKEERLRILRSDSLMNEPENAPPGTIIRVDNKNLAVACGDGALNLREIQRPGKSPLSAEEFLRGCKLSPGDQFITKR